MSTRVRAAPHTDASHAARATARTPQARRIGPRRSRRMHGALIALLSSLLWSSPWAIGAGVASAADIAISPEFAHIASDRIARDVGDTVTVLVYETSSASRASSTRTNRSSGIEAQASDGGGAGAQARAALSGGFNGLGQNGRSDNLVAQISVTVRNLKPNGDLEVAGEQTLRIDGERTHIRLHGVVRPADISTSNTVPSARLSDVVIDYDGAGFTARGARPGILNRVLSWMGLL